MRLSVHRAICVALLWAIIAVIGGGQVHAAPAPVPVKIVQPVEVNLTTIDDVRLRANHYLTNHSQLIIVLNGEKENKDSTVRMDFCRQIATQVDVLNIDFRGRGKSAGEYTRGEKEVFDLQAAVQYALTKGYTSIGVIGFGVGGYVAVKGGFFIKEISSVAIIGAPYYVEHEAPKGAERPDTALFKVGEFIVNTFTWFRVPKMDNENLSLKPYLEKMKQPLLIIHGTEDNIVPYSDAKKIDHAKMGFHFLMPLEGGSSAENLSPAHMEQVFKRLQAWFGGMAHQ